MIEAEMTTFERHLHKAVETLNAHQTANCSERGAKEEIAESNLTVHLAARLINNGYYVAAEYPLPGPQNLDLASYPLEADGTLWVAIEVKRHLHSNTEKVLADFRRLFAAEEVLEPEDRVIKCVALLNRFPVLSEWWEARGGRDLSTIRAVQNEAGGAAREFEEIKGYLNRPGTRVGRLPWYPSEPDWVYEVLYALMA